MALNTGSRTGGRKQPGASYTPVAPKDRISYPRSPGGSTAGQYGQASQLFTPSPTGQTGSVPGDDKFTSRTGIMRRTADIRQNRGLAPDAESNSIWADRVLAGTHTLGDARTRLEDKASTKATSPNAGTAKEEAPALPSLTADQFSDLSSRRRSASRTFQEALVQQANQTARFDVQKGRGLRGLDREYSNARTVGRNAYADVGTARNPRQTGKLFRRLRDEETDARSDLMEKDAMQRAALQQWVDQSRISRDDEYDAIEADRVRMKSDPNRLYSGIQF